MSAMEQSMLMLEGLGIADAVEAADIRQTMHTHAVLNITVWVNPGLMLDELSQRVYDDMPVCLVAYTQAERKELFHGLVQEVNFCKKSGRLAAQMRIASYSICMDKEPRQRSYQKESRTHLELAQLLLARYSGVCIWNNESSGLAVSRFVMQYEESDWNFLRRVTSFTGEVIIPDVSREGVRLYIGIPNYCKPPEMQAHRYIIRKQCKAPSSIEANMSGGVVAGTEIHVPELYEDYSMGETVRLEGAKWVVAGKHSRLENSLWLNDYTLRKLTDCRTSRMDNMNLCGAAICGTVLSVGISTNQLKLVTDGAGEVAESRHVQPVYYVGSGKGYSGQPEKGDMQNLYFPTEKEEDRYIISGADAGEERIMANLKQIAKDSEPPADMESGTAGKSNKAPARSAVNGSGGNSGGGSGGGVSPSTMPDSKNWTSPGGNSLTLDGSGVVLSANGSSVISINEGMLNVMSTGNIIAKTTSDLNVIAPNITARGTTKVHASCGTSNILFIPQELHIQATQVSLLSSMNEAHKMMDTDGVEAILLEYEAAMLEGPRMFAPDGTLIRREGYDDILYSEELKEHFRENVLNQNDEYKMDIGKYKYYGNGMYGDAYRKDDSVYESMEENRLYEKWLSDIYGRTKAEKIGDFLFSSEGIHAVLDTLGYVFDIADILNAAVYVAENNPEMATWSLAGAIPIAGTAVTAGKYIKKGAGIAWDLTTKNGRIISLEISDLILKQKRNAQTIVTGLSLDFKIVGDSTKVVLKDIDNSLQELLKRLGMDGGPQPKLAGVGGYGNVSEFGFLDKFKKKLAGVDATPDFDVKVKADGEDVVKHIDGLKVIEDGFGGYKATVSGDSKAFAMFRQEPDGSLYVSDHFKGNLPSGSDFLAESIKKSSINPKGSMSYTGIINKPTLQAYESGINAADTVLGKSGIRALKELGITVKSVEYVYDELRCKLSIIFNFE